MQELNEQQILRRMRTLSAMNPAADDTTRIALAAHREIKRRTIMRWTMTGGIAAALLAALVSGMLTMAPQHAAAAEELAQATTASSQFNGWVNRKTYLKGHRSFSMTHFNNLTGDWAKESRNGDGGLDKAEMCVCAENKLVAYDSDTGQFTVSAVTDEFVRHEILNHRFQSIYTAAELVNASDAPTAVTKSIEGTQTRFEGIYSYQKQDDEPTTRPTTRMSKRDWSEVIWVDTETKRVTRWAIPSMGKDGGTVVSEFSYGAPAVRDVYDLGVPRDATIVDKRPRH